MALAYIVYWNTYSLFLYLVFQGVMRRFLFLAFIASSPRFLCFFPGTFKWIPFHVILGLSWSGNLIVAMAIFFIIRIASSRSRRSFHCWTPLWLYVHKCSVCMLLVFICALYYTCAMTLLIGDSHVRRFQQFLSASNVDPFNITGLGLFDFFGISGGSIRNVDHT